MQILLVFTTKILLSSKDIEDLKIRFEDRINDTYDLHRIKKDRSVILYSGVSNKRSPMLIDFEEFFQGLRSYLQGVRLLVVTKSLFFLKDFL